MSRLIIWTHLERERRLLSCLRREGLGEPEELLELELRDVLELPERLDAEDELEPLLEPVLVLEPELEVELDRDLRTRWECHRVTFLHRRLPSRGYNSPGSLSLIAFISNDMHCVIGNTGSCHLYRTLNFTTGKRRRQNPVHRLSSHRAADRLSR